MTAKVFIAEQIDDAEGAALKLANDVKKGMRLSRHAAGILSCYSDMDLEAFTSTLARALPFPVIGATCVASFDGEQGFHEIGATLAVLTADDCAFSVAVSGSVESGGVAREIEAVYKQAAGSLGEEPKLLYMIAPHNLHIMLDEYPDVINKLAPGVPVVGGLPSSNGTDDTNAVLFGGEVCTDRIALLAISGNVQPVFSVQNVTAVATERKRRVTEAKGNTVYRVGNQTFLEYVREVGLPIDLMQSEYDAAMFVANPLLLENVTLNGESGFSFVRTLHKLDFAEGSATAIGQVPVDATLSICTLSKGDIEKAAIAGMADLKERMKAAQQRGYGYSIVFAVSCVGRYALQVPNSDAEASLLCQSLPEGMALHGVYGFGEIGPVAREDGKAYNFAHNESLVLCAL